MAESDGVAGLVEADVEAASLIRMTCGDTDMPADARHFRAIVASLIQRARRAEAARVRAGGAS